ncbi:hypothetical protein RRG08_011551 [Elysia crispata]|uniref:Uncharacterized protein n=1 Tax=Elysia crispata TaxID=231223 RepID=A0AAE0XRU4_9GAST|nr:hypothetical protein RRG08_011551 [Elysia crispata]
MSQAAEKEGWFTWLFSGDKSGQDKHGATRKVGYDRMEDSCRVDNHGGAPRAGGAEVIQRPPRPDSVYRYGYSTYQMAEPADGQDYDLQLKRKDRKPSVNSLWARIKYWVQYTWKMFKVGLMASGPGMAAGPMMAPPPMASMTSRTTRHRVAKEGPMPDVFM